ncbi:restriction endonuclease subunit S [Chryseobacterium aureum]|uniref:restriction endonuclease subunit S n=1 Tax=Chryseobacterium aureum TaxID=2497456 RepID=UPI000F862287|nr:restriction endonuclease subunit S [Chryseobacterium aureum]
MNVLDKTFQDVFIESLPANWKLSRIKDLGKIYGRIGYRGYTTSDIVEEGKGALSISPGNINNNLFTLKSKTFISWEKYYESPEIMIFPKDIILVKTGSTIGKVSLIPNIEYKLTLNPQVVVLKKIKIDNSFFYYFLTTGYIKYLFECFQSGGATPAISQEKINNFVVGFPNDFSEQTAIAQYLKTKTQTIDKKVKLLEQKIQYYKELRKSIINKAVTKGLDDKVELKESGINWIGKIPKHWEIKRFKDSVKKYTTGATPSTSNRAFFEGTNDWICISDISKDKYIFSSETKLTDDAIKSANMVITPIGSLLYSFKLSIGKVAFAGKDVYTNEAILSIFPNKLIDLEYYYFMLPIFLYLQATENIYGAKMLNQKLISSAFVVNPPKNEQIQIAQYLNEKISVIDRIEKNIEIQITTFKELRKTLINNVVTGKIKVTND